MQKLGITAQTKADEYDLSGQVKLYSIKHPKAGEPCKAVITFMAVPDKSKSLFTRFGTGQKVYLGCSELKTEYSFVSLGRFLCVRLTLNASQEDLKLEDGSPFDITQYSLKPVLTVKKVQ